MEISKAISLFFEQTEYKNWNRLGCLEYLETLKIELKDMIDNFRDELHFKKEDLAKIFVMGIQATVPTNIASIKHTLLMLNKKITSTAIARHSTPSPPSSPPHQTSNTPKVNQFLTKFISDYKKN
ncbi:5451_t:CDS:2 [Cetraspora pellucida]|uniref:5451_t:CDS:1 n=1 Tax=Cetraspora pellucida TaxID=1433469 RepID=A0A9N8VJK4_9GLOM|nr:5451_t:CDS:2 [Cetraspora pellucida]